MRNTVIGLLTAAALASSAATQEGGAADDEARRLQRMQGLCELWGSAKFLHPAFASGDVDWDLALVETLPGIDGSEDSEGYRASVDKLLSYLGDSVSRTLDHTHSGVQNPRQEAVDVEVDPAALETEGIGLVITRNLPGVGLPSMEYGPEFQRLRGSRVLIVDLRLDEAGDPFSRSVANQRMAEAFARGISLLVEEDLVLPGIRRRFHSGYAPRIGTTSGGFHSGFSVDESVLVVPAEADERPLPALILIVNRASADLSLGASALRAAGRALILQEGPAPPAASTELSRLKLTGGVLVDLLVGERLLEDGTLGFAADEIVAEGAALARALELARTADPLSLATEPVPSARTARPAQPMIDDVYADMAPPALEYRQLALFRLYAVMDRFFAYEPLMDASLPQLFAEYLPRLEAAADDLAYHLTVAELCARFQDSQVQTVPRRSVFAQHFGQATVPAAVGFAEGQLVVLAVPETAPDYAPSVMELSAGDVVESIDGEEIQARFERYGKYHAASTPQALRVRVAPYLLSGPADQPARLRVRGADGSVRELEVGRSTQAWPHVSKRVGRRPIPEHTLLPDNIGYIDLDRLEKRRVSVALNDLKDVRGFILDLRGSPQGTAWSLVPFFDGSGPPAALLSRPYVSSVERLAGAQHSFVQRVPRRMGPKYAGKVAVLINAETIGQAEHTCLFLEQTVEDLTFVGSPSAGANGDVTSLVLPGGILVRFSGHDVRHADGRQLQRAGIQPDLEASPTIEGIRAGRDEVLEAAFRFLRTELGE